MFFAMLFTNGSLIVKFSAETAKCIINIRGNLLCIELLMNDPFFTEKISYTQLLGKT